MDLRSVLRLSNIGAIHFDERKENMTVGKVEIERLTVQSSKPFGGEKIGTGCFFMTRGCPMQLARNRKIDLSPLLPQAAEETGRKTAPRDPERRDPWRLR